LCAAALAGPQPGQTEILILYDNTVAQSGLTADWGFAALVTHQGRRVLLDTGAKADVFIDNLRKLKVDPASIEHVVISHAHQDHTGGLERLAPLNPRLVVHGPAGPGAFEVVPGVFSTGLVEGQVFEQALVVDTPKGLVILTGCSHPGVVRMVEAARQQRGKDSVRLLLGGFHMLQQSAEQIQATIAELKRLNVAMAVPMHCSGDLTMKLFREAFGAGPGAGVGRRIVLD
jgi:7,8-dihydropterin-6-yl-methyl-4-(beta-D-ribofuranosyl)aminobenzene 5'-phosphate synthase